MVKFCGVNKTSRGSLLSFQAGGRILRYLAEAQAREHSLNIALACGPPQYVAAVDRLKNDVKNHVVRTAHCFSAPPLKTKQAQSGSSSS